MQVWTPVGVICRPTQREAEEFMDYLVEHADRGALGHLAEMHASDARGRTDEEGGSRPRGAGGAAGAGAGLVLHDWGRGARRRGDRAPACVGFDGLVLNFVDYLEEFPYFAQEVLPRLEREGLRFAA